MELLTERCSEAGTCVNTHHFFFIILTTASFSELLYGCFEVLFNTQIPTVSEATPTSTESRDLIQ